MFLINLRSSEGRGDETGQNSLAVHRSGPPERRLRAELPAPQFTVSSSRDSTGGRSSAGPPNRRRDRVCAPNIRRAMRSAVRMDTSSLRPMHILDGHRLGVRNRPRAEAVARSIPNHLRQFPRRHVLAQRANRLPTEVARIVSSSFSSPPIWSKRAGTGAGLHVHAALIWQRVRSDTRRARQSPVETAAPLCEVLCLLEKTPPGRDSLIPTLRFRTFHFKSGGRF